MDSLTASTKSCHLCDRRIIFAFAKEEIWRGN